MALGGEPHPLRARSARSERGEARAGGVVGQLGLSLRAAARRATGAGALAAQSDRLAVEYAGWVRIVGTRLDQLPSFADHSRHFGGMAP